MVHFINLGAASPGIKTSGEDLQHKIVIVCLLACLLSSLCMVAGCGFTPSLFTCFSSSAQTWRSPSANVYEQTDDLGGQDSGNAPTTDPVQVDQATAAACVHQLLSKLPSDITLVQAALDNMYLNDKPIVIKEIVKQLPTRLLQRLVQTRPGRLLVFHVFLDATELDPLTGAEPRGPGGNPATARKLKQMLFASFPDFQRLYNQPWLGNPTVQAAASRNGTSFQTLEEGNGPYSFDDFTIIIQNMPPGLSPQTFLVAMARNINQAANDAQFDNLSAFKWRNRARPPLVGDSNDIDFGSLWGLPTSRTPSPVMLVEQTPTHFIFQTLRGHILHEVREFGFYALSNGSMVLYTRAISRDSSFLSLPFNKGTSSRANELLVRTWTNFMIGVCAKMQRRGGFCNPYSSDAGEPPWLRRLNLS